MKPIFKLGEVLYHISGDKETAKGTLVKIENGLKGDNEEYISYTLKYSNNHICAFSGSYLFRTKNEALDKLVEKIRNQYE